MKDTHRPSTLVAAELEEAKRAYGAICDRIQALKTELSQLEIDRDKLCATAGLYRQDRVGRIPSLERELSISQRDERDEKAVRVVWSIQPKHWESAEKIVDKVTAKRIYVREPGRGGHAIYSLDGHHENGYTEAVIDIQATFGVPTINAKAWPGIRDAYISQFDESRKTACNDECGEPVLVHVGGISTN